MNLTKLLSSKGFTQGISFGIVSSVMTVLGLCFSVWITGGSLKLIVSSLLGLTISNSLADAFSMYMANKATGDDDIALLSASVTGLIEFIVPFVFLIPLFIFKKKTALFLDIAIGTAMIVLVGLSVAKKNETDARIGEHILVYLLVLYAILGLSASNGLLVNRIGPWISKFD